MKDMSAEGNFSAVVHGQEFGALNINNIQSLCYEQDKNNETYIY